MGIWQYTCSLYNLCHMLQEQDHALPVLVYFHGGETAIHQSSFWLRFLALSRHCGSGSQVVAKHDFQTSSWHQPGNKPVNGWL